MRLTITTDLSSTIDALGVVWILRLTSGETVARFRTRPSRRQMAEAIRRWVEG